MLLPRCMYIVYMYYSYYYYLGNFYERKWAVIFEVIEPLLRWRGLFSNTRFKLFSSMALWRLALRCKYRRYTVHVRAARAAAPAGPVFYKMPFKIPLKSS